MSHLAPGRRAHGVRVSTALLVVMGAVASVVGVGSVVAADPVVTVTPNAGLVDGQEITVAGTGSIPDAEVEVLLCAVGDADCGYWFGYTISSGGGFVITETVRAQILDSRGDLVDCRSAPCELIVSAWTFDPDQHLELARVALDFDPDGAVLAPPTIAVDPDHDLVHGQVVSVTGTGHKPDSPVYIEECPADLDGDHRCRPVGDVLAGGDGSFTASVSVTSVLPAGFMSFVDPLDCRTSGGTCTLLAVSAWGSATAALHFDPAGPIPPPASIVVDPATDMADGDTVTVSGTGFSPSGLVAMRYCEVAGSRCDITIDSFFGVGEDGTFTVELSLFEEIVDHEGFLSCTVTPGCEVLVQDLASGEVARAPVSFRPRAEAGDPRPYLDPVFGEVQKVEGIVYRSTTDVDGNPIELALDLYLPVGDTSTLRPSIMWMFGGWFMFGDRTQLTAYAMDSARRGYVGVAIDYRIRPDMPLAEVLLAAADAEEDARAAVEWLKANAATYGLDPNAIVAAGVSAGAVLAWNLAYGASDADPVPSPVAGAVPISGVPFSGPEVGAPPVIAFHGDADGILPIGPDRDTCPKAAPVGSVCELVEFPGGGHYIAESEARTIIAHIYPFLAEHVLGPLGYFDAEPPTPGPTPVPPVVVTPWSPGAVAPTTAPSSTTSTAPPPATTPTTTEPTSPPAAPTSSAPPGPTTPVTTPPALPSSAGDASAGPSVGGGTARPARPLVASPSYTG